MEVETGIPIPPRQPPGKWVSMARSMFIGQSFVVKTDAERKCALRINTKLKDVQLTSRKLNGSGWRIWRVK